MGEVPHVLWVKYLGLYGRERDLTEGWYLRLIDLCITHL